MAIAAEKNLKLSTERATAVKQYLLANMDIDPGLVAALGYGEKADEVIAFEIKAKVRHDNGDGSDDDDDDDHDDDDDD